ncbi:hypothetical protein MSIMFB_03587 [Mycobacterium simulans]|uniref:ANTAR domain-containing protein n=1 Tax=Mycobacterium simulans TaxID=627089 RepID=A0A7Z7IM30_9MYCO|nr:ANTAR domain-containing protein [Mycobacterium simulans]SOJ56113.1 hypothetical protein MSIMFB_03587 [Mycobacterium simulans]SON61689.1 hypothetical protein MSIMFI_03206 [Mycobacterium simulans]
MIEGLQNQLQRGAGGHESTRDLDTAVGILVGWRRYSTYAAFRELISASERHRVPIFALAGALVNLACRDADTARASTPAQLAAEREWGR